MITAILITVMICTTLLIISKYGVNIKIDKNYVHVYRDETSYQLPKGEELQVFPIKDLIKDGEDPKSVEDFIERTTNVFKDYFEEDKHGKD